MAQKTERVRLNAIARQIGNVEIKAGSKGMYWVVLKGKRANLCFEGDFATCQAYLYGIRDVATANG